MERGCVHSALLVRNVFTCAYVRINKADICLIKIRYERLYQIPKERSAGLRRPLPWNRFIARTWECWRYRISQQRIRVGCQIPQYGVSSHICWRARIPVASPESTPSTFHVQCPTRSTNSFCIFSSFFRHFFMLETVELQLPY